MGGCLSKSRPTAEDTSLQSVGATKSGADDAAASNKQENVGDTPAAEVEYCDIEENIKTGDLAVLFREGQDTPHFAVFIQHPEDDPDFPLLLVKCKTKPLLKLESGFKQHPALGRQVYTTTAVQRIFYGDYKKVLVRHLDGQTDEKPSIDKVMETVEKINKIPFSEYELEAINKASTDDAKSGLLSALVIAHFYKLMPVSGDPPFDGDPCKVTPRSLEECLKLSQPKSIKIPSPRPGPLHTGSPPLLHKLLIGTMDPPEGVTVVPYDDVASTLNTGDLILFSGVTSTGAVIKVFDDARFSHVAIVIKCKHTKELRSWEAITNKNGLVDIESGKVLEGVNLLPIRYQLYSGWNSCIAFRRLTGVSDEQREEMYKKLLQFRKTVQGRPYEKSKINLILAAFDFSERFLTFLNNEEEDLSSLFCSELVAEAYQRMGVLDSKKSSSEYTPDDFSSARDDMLTLKCGRFEPEVYVDLNRPQ